ncbi:MAG: 16S rRNA (cytidine(1402)-2'-O)-methyltransferase [Chloroflexi bacterium]|nr:16S rRNA (cytidine(1402)-2'-O)-methyltransferase [Chloroflexota bacterium]
MGEQETIYLVATPIGNLGDLSLRALEVLRSADVIAAEDTRRTRILLNHYNVHRPLTAFHAHNERRAVAPLIALASEGQTVAIVTDAGSPGIADPGYSVVRAAIVAHVEVSVIPGPTAFVAALILSGLPAHSFTFRGFPPHKRGPRRQFLSVDVDSPHTLVFYESPYRLLHFLDDALEVFGDRPAAVASELTKVFERIERGTLSDLAARFRGRALRGEYTAVIAGSDYRVVPSDLPPESACDE